VQVTVVEPTAPPPDAEVIVTSWVVFAFAFVKVSDPGATVALAVSEEVHVTVTSAPGKLFSTTVKVSVCPPAVTL
jgi:hypothetical protein